jgi:hypothetical protein
LERQRTRVWAKLSKGQKKALDEKFGITTAEQLLAVSVSRAEEVQQVLVEAKVGWKERAGTAWKGIGKGLWKGIKAPFKAIGAPGTRKGLTKSAKESRAKGFGIESPTEETTGQTGVAPPEGRRRRPRRPSQPGPAMDISAAMEAIKAIQATNLDNKNDIITNILRRAGLVQ